MKRSLILGMAAALLILAAPLRGDNGKPPAALRAFTLAACGTVMLDTFLTWDGIYRHGCEEENPFWRPIIRKPAIVLTIDLGICFGIVKGSEAGWKKDKFLGWLIPAVVVIVQSWVLYDHLKVRRMR